MAVSHTSDVEPVPETSAWYARRDGVIRGPFSPMQVTRYILLGRVRLSDQLSADLESWQEARELVILQPGLMPTCDQSYRDAILHAEERVMSRRSQDKTGGAFHGTDRRVLPDRRLNAPVQVRHACLDHHEMKQGKPVRRIGYLLVTLLLACLVFAWMAPAWS
jgi:hypothetical protein